MDSGLVPLEPLLLLGYGRPLLIQMLHEIAQDLGAVGGVDRGTPGEYVGTDDTLRVQRHLDRLFGLTAMHLGPGCSAVSTVCPVLTSPECAAHHCFVLVTIECGMSFLPEVHSSYEVGADLDLLLF